MSYTSTSVFAASTTAPQVRDVIGLLGFKRVRDGLSVPNRVGGYFWYGETDFRSWSGVELYIYKSGTGAVTVTTRSTVSRSHWDLVHQNRTLKLLRDLFGGHFETDAGKNRYWRPDFQQNEANGEATEIEFWGVASSKLMQPSARCGYSHA